MTKSQDEFKIGDMVYVRNMHGESIGIGKIVGIKRTMAAIKIHEPNGTSVHPFCLIEKISDWDTHPWWEPMHIEFQD